MPIVMYSKPQHFSAAGGLPPFDFTEQTRSVDLAGNFGGERLENSTLNLLGIADTWTAMFWFKNNNQSGTNKVFRTAETGGVINLIDFSFITAGTFLVTLRNATSSIYKDYGWSALVSDTGNWHQVVITLDGATDTLTLYYDSSPTAPSSTSDPAVANPTDTARFVGLFGREGNDQQTLNGIGHQGALWDVVLDGDAVTSIFNGGDGSSFNLRENSGNYNSAANVQHWWRLGDDDSADSQIGADSGVASTLINVSDNQVGITVADDVVTDAP